MRDALAGGHAMMSLCTLAVLVAASVGGGDMSRALPVTMQDDALMLHRADPEGSARRMAAIGADRLRITAGWSALAPQPRSRRRPRFDATDPGQYPAEPWSRLDRAVKAADAAGLEVALDVAFWAPRWAVARAVDDPERQRWRPSSAEFGQFARAVALRYGGNFPDPAGTRRRPYLPRVNVWTTWNEPNHPGFLLPQWVRGRRGWRASSPHVYRELHNAAYDSIKRVNPENQVLIGGLAAEAASTQGPARQMSPLRFLRELACVDGALNPLARHECRGFRALQADGFAHHPYTLHTSPDTVSPDPETVRLADLDRLTALLTELGRRGRIAPALPLHLTEYGYETNPPDPRRGVTLDEQARRHGQATFIAWQRRDTASFAQFLLQDLGPDRRYPPGHPRRWHDFQTGLVTHTGEDKPALQAFKLPFWAETRRVAGQPVVVVFGQVRPGARAHRVQLEAQGPDGEWRPVSSADSQRPDEALCGAEEAEFETDARGFYLRTVAFRGPMAYRALWIHGGDSSETSVPVSVRRSPGG